MKLHLEITTEGGAMTLKGLATFPFNASTWKHRLRTWAYRIAFATLLLWPTQCDGSLRAPPPGCHETSTGCVMMVGQANKYGSATAQNRGGSPATGALAAGDL